MTDVYLDIATQEAMQRVIASARAHVNHINAEIPKQDPMVQKHLLIAVDAVNRDIDIAEGWIKRADDCREARRYGR